MLLTNNGFKGSRAVFACRNNKIIHRYKGSKKLLYLKA